MRKKKKIKKILKVIMRIKNNNILFYFNIYFNTLKFIINYINLKLYYYNNKNLSLKKIYIFKINNNEDLLLKIYD